MSIRDLIRDFIRASEIGDLNLVESLVRDGIDINSRNEYGETALIRAAENGKLDVVQFLIRSGANVDVVDYGGNSALMYASRYDHPEVVRELLRAGASLWLKNIYDFNALMFAIYDWHPEMIRELVKQGASIDTENKAVMELLSKTDKLGHLGELLELLREKNTIDQRREKGNFTPKRVDINLRDKNGKTDLMRASEVGDHGEVQTLLMDGANVNLQDNNGYTALMYAAFNNHLYVVTSLLQAKEFALIGKRQVDSPLADLQVDFPLIYLQDEYGNTALMFAAFKGYGEIMYYLLKHAIVQSYDDPEFKQYFIDLQNDDGMTALMWAAENNHLGAVRILLENGASSKLRNKDGKTASDLAKDNEVKQYLLTYPNIRSYW